MLGILLVSVFGAFASDRTGTEKFVVDSLSALALLGLVVAFFTFSSSLVKKMRAEQQTVEGIGELVQMRRWTEAAAQLDHYLSSPARNQTLRVQALVYLSAVLARYQRHVDAIEVHDYLLESEMLDSASNYGLRLGRAMAMLHEDQLLDADRAISELKRQGPSGVESGGLALVEIYRDVKTGHSEDAVIRFKKSLPAMKQQLGHRIADAWALVARAYDLLNQPAEAAEAFRNATLLTPPIELFRRYPEVRKLEGRYEPGYAPAEAA